MKPELQRVDVEAIERQVELGLQALKKAKPVSNKYMFRGDQVQGLRDFSKYMKSAAARAEQAVTEIE